MLGSVKPLRVTQETVDLYAGDKKNASFSADRAYIGGKTVHFEASGPADLYLGDWLGNPATTFIPSDIVTPHTTYIALPEALGVVGSLIWAILEIIQASDNSKSNSNSHSGRINKPTVYQVKDYNERLPEDV